MANLSKGIIANWVHNEGHSKMLLECDSQLAALMECLQRKFPQGMHCSNQVAVLVVVMKEISIIDSCPHPQCIQTR